MTAAATLLEQLIADRVVDMVGDPIFIGIGLLLMMLGIIVFSDMDLAPAALLFGSSAFLVFTFIPALRIIVGIMFGLVFALGILKVRRQ